MFVGKMDTIILGFDRALRIITGHAKAMRPTPGEAMAEGVLDAGQRQHSAGLMRVNHVGEVCAQALYSAQARFARTEALRQQFIEAGKEEEDHLAWTAQRLRELGAGPSLLNPIWFGGAYLLGAVAAKVGDAASLGFVVETERQVEAHLASHLQKLPPNDIKSLAIVEAMRQDEVEHGAAAQALGAATTPAPVRLAMRLMSKVMTATAYRI